MVLHLIGPYLIDHPIGTHAPPISLVPLSLPPSLRLIAPIATRMFVQHVLYLIGPPTHQSPISLVPISTQLAPMHHPPPPPPPPISLVPHRTGPFSPVGPPIHKKLSFFFLKS